MHWWEEGERPGQIISPPKGRQRHTHTHRDTHRSSSPPGLHVGGLWVENRRPGEEPTQEDGEHVNFTQKGSRLICEPWTCSAAKVYLAAPVIANLFYCTHSYLSFLCERKSFEHFFFLSTTFADLQEPLSAFKCTAAAEIFPFTCVISIF